MASADDDGSDTMFDINGGIGAAANTARRGHLALIEGGRMDSVASSTTSARTATAYVRGGGQETTRSRQELSVQAVARQHDDFTAALPAMVRASGVSPRSADAVVNAINNNATLRAQALKAFEAARGGA